MNKKLSLWTLSALLCVMTLTAVSCKDDDNNEPSAEEQEQQAQEQAEQNNVRFAILDNLADMSSAADDFLAGNYEPTIGQADDSEAGTRIVGTNTMEAAAERFATLVGADISETTPSYTWTDDEMGTLTYTKSQDGRSWATVDVNLRQVPHLQKIVYRSAEQGGDNASVEGTAYYRFGDVVRRKNADNVDEYWICVRPAFGPEGKGTSHWVTISPLPKKNVWHYKGSNGIQYAMPTLLSDNFEHSQNFAEMLFAICNPTEWYDNINAAANKKLPMFHDFHKANREYHSEDFWRRVQTAWTYSDERQGVKSVISTIFGSNATLESLQQIVGSPNGLNLLTNGYSWITKGIGATNSPTLYRYRFVNGTGAESNMHKRIGGGLITKYASVKAEVISAKITLNVEQQYRADNLGWVNEKFFGCSDKHFIIRHATGAELASDGQEDAKYALNGVEEIYTYNDYYDNDLGEAPEMFRIRNDKNDQELYDFEGNARYHIGDVYQDQHNHLWFVVNMAGSKTEKSPYSELVSFEGIETDGYGRATNIATRDQADRGAMFLWMMFHSIAPKKSDSYLSMLANLLKFRIDPTTFFQAVKAQSGDFRQTTLLASYAYRDDDAQEQPAVRFVLNNQNDKQDFYIYLWDKYPIKPDATTQFVTDFTEQTIMLDHVASQSWVDLYAMDTYAIQPLVGSEDYRQPRSVADPEAVDVSHFFYDFDAWKARTYPTDMWNAPVLVFRMTAVYDRGTTYATRTVDGLDLRLVGQWTAPGDLPGTFTNMMEVLAAANGVVEKTLSLRYLNGGNESIKPWSKVWK